MIEISMKERIRAMKSLPAGVIGEIHSSGDAATIAELTGLVIGQSFKEETI